jgi:hypothetical protein
MLKKSIFVLALTLPFVYSCKKEGCTDSTALNYSNSAKKDDGSCITEQDIKNTSPQNLYVENFNLTFDNSTSLGFYIPSVNFQDGDMIIIETINEYDEWTSLPYIFGVDIHVEGSYTQDGTIWISLKNDDGTDFYPSSSITVPFRAGLIKKNGLILNPNLKDMTISELELL